MKTKSKGSKLFLAEWSSLARNRKLLISLTAIMLIPLLYSFTFLWAFWDPYGRMNDLPVAVVNQDKGATFQNKELHIGDDFIAKLKESGDFKYDFVSNQEAIDGMRDRKYYLAFEIPADFSANATKVTDPSPKPIEFKFMPNESLNFLTAQIGKSAVEKMKTSIAHELTKAYTAAVFDNIGELSSGLTKAADGAKELADGTKRVEDGITQIDENLGKLNSGTIPLKAGVSELSKGTGALNAGAVELKQGAGELSGGLTQLSGGSAKLAAGAGELQGGLAQLQGGLADSVAGLDKLQAGTAGLSSALDALATGNPALAESPEFKQLAAMASQLKEGAAAAAAGQKQLAGGADKLAAPAGTLATGMSELSQKLAAADEGGKRVASGADALQQGTGVLQSGLVKLAGGVNELSSGSALLKDGTGKLAEGVSAVTAGSSELSDKLADAANKTGDIQTTDDNYSVMADPVRYVEEKNGEVPNYGTGFAPYFLSLGLFVGALMMTIKYPLTETAVEPRSALRWFMAKFGTMFIMATIQGLLAAVILLYGLQLDVQSVPKFILLSLVTSWCFVAIMQFLATAFNDPGRFIGIILLIIQLVASAGTFPVELIPAPLQGLSAFVPMTYSVSGFKAAISSGQSDAFWMNLSVLAGIFIVIAGLLLLTFTVFFKRGKHADIVSTNA